MRRLGVKCLVLLTLITALSLLMCSCSSEEPSADSTSAAGASTETTAAAGASTETTAAAGASTETTAAAEPSAEKIKLKFGSLYAEPHWHAVADMRWIEYIESETDGRVEIEYFPGASLVSFPDHYFEVASGMADICQVEAGGQPAGFDIHRAIQGWFWGGPEDARERLKIALQWYEEFPEILEEYKDVKLISTQMGTEYRIITTKPVHSKDDIKGLSMKAQGDYAKWITSLGGEGIPCPMGEVYLNMEKGIMQGALAPYEVLKASNFADVAKYVLEVQIIGMPNPYRIMNWDTWNALPADIQKIFEDSIPIYNEFDEEEMARVNQEGYEWGKEKGVEFFVPTAEVAAELVASLEDICRESAAELDGKGYRGTEMYERLRQLIAEAAN